MLTLRAFARSRTCVLLSSFSLSRFLSLSSLAIDKPTREQGENMTAFRIGYQGENLRERTNFPAL